MIACGDDGYVVSGPSTIPQPSEPEVAPEDDTPRTSFRDARGIELGDELDSDPHFIPPYWITFQPSRMFIIVTSGTAGPKREKLTINNRGTERVRLRSISIAGGQSDSGAVLFDITGLPEQDSLGPGESTQIEVTFYPATSSMVSGTISVLTDMPSNPDRAVPITAKSFR